MVNDSIQKVVNVVDSVTVIDECHTKTEQFGHIYSRCSEPYPLVDNASPFLWSPPHH